MTSPENDDSYKSQVYRSMREKETAELAAIWQENDREAWSQEAFDAVEALLLERLGELPEQTGVVETDEPATQRKLSPRIAYPGDQRMIRIADWAGWLSWAILGVGAIQFVLWGVSIFTGGAAFVLDQFIYGLVNRLAVLLSAGMSFLMLQAVAEIIYLLMDIRTLAEPETQVE